MTEKELKKLNRKQLLELLLKQTEMTEELQRRLEATEAKLHSRTIAEREAGSIAEAAMKLNGVFEAAEAAAAQYLENIKRMSEDSALDIKRKKLETVNAAKAIIAKAQRCAEDIESKAERKLSEINSLEANISKKNQQTEE